MTTFIVVLHVFACLILIVVILLQAGRGQGLSWGGFGGSPQSIFGTKTASFMTRLTTACAVIFLITCLSLNVIEIRKSKSLVTGGQPITAVDMDKIKKALEEAAKKEAAPPPSVAAPVAEKQAA